MNLEQDLRGHFSSYGQVFGRELPGPRHRLSQRSGSQMYDRFPRSTIRDNVDGP